MSHTEPQDPQRHPKQDFQVERLAFFSDAVFAIAITLLALEIKVPHVDHNTKLSEVMAQLLALRFNLFAILFSFLMISDYWIRHHFLFKHIHNYNKKIVTANLALLLPIIFFPFTTTFLAASLDNQNVVFVALQLFILNNFLAGACLYYIYWLITVKHVEYSYDIDKEDRFKFIYDTLITTIIFAVVLVVSIFSRNIMAIYAAILIGQLAKRYFGAYYAKKNALKKPAGNWLMGGLLGQLINVMMRDKPTKKHPQPHKAEVVVSEEKVKERKQS